MAIIQCLECKAIISDKADYCYKCGFPIDFLYWNKILNEAKNGKELDEVLRRIIKEIGVKAFCAIKVPSSTEPRIKNAWISISLGGGVKKNRYDK